MFQEDRFDLVRYRSDAANLAVSTTKSVISTVEASVYRCAKSFNRRYGADFARNLSAVSLCALAVLGPLAFLDGGQNWRIDSVQKATSHAGVTAELLEVELARDGSAQPKSGIRKVQSEAWQTGMIDAIADFAHFQARVEGEFGKPDSDLYAASLVLRADNERVENRIRAAWYALDGAAQSYKNDSVFAGGSDLQRLTDEIKLLQGWADTRTRKLSDIIARAESSKEFNHTELQAAYVEGLAWAYVGSQIVDQSIKNFEIQNADFASTPEIKAELSSLSAKWNKIAARNQTSGLLVLGSNTPEGRDRLASMAFGFMQISNQSAQISQSLEHYLDLSDSDKAKNIKPGNNLAVSVDIAP